MTQQRSLHAILRRIHLHEAQAAWAFNFTPSENVMSPLARLPLVLDLYGRYYFDHFEIFDEWLFHGGVTGGLIQPEHLEPMLRAATGVDLVDTRPISGINCMTIVIAGLCKVGDTMYVVPESWGGHLSTITLATRLGVRTVELPYEDHELDIERLDCMLATDPPDVIYIDQSTQLFPIDVRPIRELIDERGLATVIHYDGSHVNGLVVGGALANPLERGAHTFGGSTHKTLPGPHKGFVATDDLQLYERIGSAAYHFVSHRQPAASAALAITLVEMDECGGSEYAHAILANATRFAAALDGHGARVAQGSRGYTACHQVWAASSHGVNSTDVANRMRHCGLLVNKLPSLPGFAQPAFRLSIAEYTRMGAGPEEVDEAADLFARLLRGDRDLDLIRRRVADLRRALPEPRYCFTPEQLDGLSAPAWIVEAVRDISRWPSLAGAGGPPDS